jgi:hypothetical protein
MHNTNDLAVVMVSMLLTCIGVVLTLGGCVYDATIHLL